MKKSEKNTDWFDDWYAPEPVPREEDPEEYEDEEYQEEYFDEDEEYGDEYYEDEYDGEYYEDDEDWEEEEDVTYEEEAPPPPPKKKKKKKPAGKKKRRRKKKRFLRRLLLFVLLAALVSLFLGTPPVRNPEGAERRPGRSTILLAGTDADGTRTDTIMLLSLERGSRSLRLLSIPRDTYAEGYAAFKINSAYAAGGKGAAGMEELMGQVERTIGFSPDAYVLVDLDCFIRAVDLLGGVDFNVPVDMHYEDPSQGLYIDLRAGEQHLSGEQAMGLVRFRSGYATADIGRTEVQREFIKTALRQWMRPSSAAALPELWRLYRENVITDLSPRELLWVARVLLKADIGGMQTDVLPGWADMVGGSSVYMVDRTAAAEVLRAYSPYQ